MWESFFIYWGCTNIEERTWNFFSVVSEVFSMETLVLI